MGGVFVSRCIKQRGSSLIEVLVAFCIFSVGILGTFSLQISAKRINSDAAQHSIATALARDIFARMRVNAGALDAYVVDALGVEELQAVSECRDASCSHRQRAERDIYEWSESLSGGRERVAIGGHDIGSGGLVDAKACIKNDAGIVSVSISWRSLGAAIGAGSEPCGERISPEKNSGTKFSALTMTSYVTQP